MSEKYIAVRGYWKTNLGDDLFLKVLCQRFPDVTFKILVSEKHSAVFNNIPNLECLFLTDFDVFKDRLSRRFNIVFLLKEYWLFKNSYCGVEIGGSIFMTLLDGKSWKYRLKIRKKLSDSVNNNYFVIGSNFGPFKSENEVSQYSKFFESINYTVFRDSYSRTLFDDIDNMSLAPDAVFNLDVGNNLIDSENYIVISVINLNRKDKSLNSKQIEKYERSVANIANLYIEQGKKIMFMSFCEDEGDLNAINRIINYVHRKNRRYIKIFSHTNLTQSLNVLKQSNRIVASRFHAMILGWLLQKPTFVVSYSNKTNDVINDLNPNQNYETVETIGDLNINSSNIDSLFSVIEDLRLSQIRKDSEEQFKHLKSFLSI